MGQISRESLYAIRMDGKLLTHKLPEDMEAGKMYPVLGKSGKEYRLKATENSIEVFDLSSQAQLSTEVKNGVVQFTVITRPSDKEKRYNKDFDAKEFIHGALYYLEEMGNDTNTFEATWNYGTNFEQYRNNIKNQLPVSEAAFQTWTGSRALEAHYSQVIARSRTGLDASKYIFHFIK